MPYSREVLKIVVRRVFPADKVAVRDDPARGFVAIGIDHGLVRLPGKSLVDPGDKGRLAEYATIRQAVVRYPETERDIAGEVVVLGISLRRLYRLLEKQGLDGPATA